MSENQRIIISRNSLRANTMLKQNHKTHKKYSPPYRIVSLFLLISLISTLLIQFPPVELRGIHEYGDNFQENDIKVPFLSPQNGEKHTRKNQATVVKELVSRISLALSAMTGDHQPMVETGSEFVAPAAPANGVSSLAHLETAENMTSSGSEVHEKTDVGEMGDEEATDVPVELRNLTDNERLLELQDSLQKWMKGRLMETARTSMELFQRLSLSGGCSSSLMNLMGGLGELKSYAFKFLDASAKIPSGVMYGLLSDFGDFDQCLSIRSNPEVPPEMEVEERSFSGKYCLLNVRLDYHIQLGPNGSAPEGIITDGVLWDDLLRNYWTSKSQKGFQIGVCVPSRCNKDDLDQIYRAVADKNNILGEVMSCQDSNDLREQSTPDLVQSIIMGLFGLLLMLNFIGTLLERYWFDPIVCERSKGRSKSVRHKSLVIQLLLCFSIRRNWALFMRKQDAPTSLAFNYESPTAADQQVEQSAKEAACAQFAYKRRLVSQLIGSIVSTNPDTRSTSLVGTQNCTFAGSSATVNSDCASAKLNEHLATPIEFSTLSTKDSNDRNSTGCNSSEGGCIETSSCMLQHSANAAQDQLLSHLTGFKLFVIVWITIGHSFLYPSANNYQHYRSIIKMNITRDSVWFATTNFTLGIDMLLYMSGLVFVYKLSYLGAGRELEPSSIVSSPGTSKLSTLGICGRRSSRDGIRRIAQELTKRILRFWPTYSCVIAIAIIVPLFGDGPMWPEMVASRLGDSCRKNWWANLLVVNNFFNQSDICLPSSWFVSVLMQLFFVGSLVMLGLRKYSMTLATVFVSSLLLISSAVVFLFAYHMEVKAPVIRMDESFVMELDSSIFHLYTNIFSNMGPFLVGMLGGFILVKWKTKQMRQSQLGRWQQMSNFGQMLIKTTPQDEQLVLAENKAEDLQNGNTKEPKQRTILSNLRRRGSLFKSLKQLFVALIMILIAVSVLSSVFHENYSQIMSACYWSLHRVGWAAVTGYIIHQAAIGRWRLLKDLFSLSHFIPCSRLIFIAYLVFPIFIHLHSGFVRDGLHVSIYNMTNIYVTRLALTFALSLFIHLLVELPFCSVEAILLTLWVTNGRQRSSQSSLDDNSTKQDQNKDNDETAINNKEEPLLVGSTSVISMQAASDKS